MKKHKNGVSLIVLIITIIVIIILAAAVILTVQKSNPISDARTAVEKEDYTEAQNAYNMWLSQVMVKQRDTVKFTGWITNGNVKMKDYQKTASDKSEDKNQNGPNWSRLGEGNINKITTDYKSNVIKNDVYFVSGSGANLSEDVISEFVKEVNIDKLGLPEQIKAIYIKDNKVTGVYKNDTISFLNVDTGDITVDQTTVPKK